MTIRNLKQLLAFLLVICAPLSSVASSKNYDLESFIIRNVQVFSDSGDQKDSKKIALMNAANAHLPEVLERIVIHNSTNKLANILKRDNSDLVLEYQFLDQRITSHSYSATVNIIFNRELIRDILVKHGIMFGDKLFDKCLFIPVKNQHKTKWALLNPSLMRVGMVVPIMIKEDIEAIDTVGISSDMKEPYGFFKHLLGIYEAENILLFEAFQKDKVISVKARFLTKSDSYQKIYYYDNTVSEQKIILDVLKDLDSWWKGDKSLFKMEELFSHDDLH